MLPKFSEPQKQAWKSVSRFIGGISNRHQAASEDHAKEGEDPEEWATCAAVTEERPEVFGETCVNSNNFHAGVVVFVPRIFVRMCQCVAPSAR